MGCLWPKKNQTQEVEINSEVSQTLEHPFNDNNCHKFLGKLLIVNYKTQGYPRYEELLKFLESLMNSQLSEWAAHKQSLELHKRKIEKYLIILNYILDRNEKQLSTRLEDIQLEFEDIPLDFNLNFGNQFIIDIQCGLFKLVPIETSYFVTISIQGKENYTNLKPAAPIIEWNQAFVQELDIKTQSKFTFQLMALFRGQQVPTYNQATFLGDEMKDQSVHEKSIKLKDKNDVQGVIQMKCQLINDVKEFCLHWKQELITVQEQINRMLVKIEQGQDLNSQMTQSLINRDISETTYGIPYQIQ